jgi:superfamily II DNA or RNA helicase
MAVRPPGRTVSRHGGERVLGDLSAVAPDIALRFVASSTLWRRAAAGSPARAETNDRIDTHIASAPAPDGGVEIGAPVTTTVPAWQFDLWVEAEADGAASPEELTALEADRRQWRATLVRLLREAEAHLASARSLRGAERNQVLADAQYDVRRLTAAWNRFEGITEDEVDDAPAARDGRARDEASVETGEVRLQVSWEPGRVVAWGGGPGRESADRADLEALLAASGAPFSRATAQADAPWADHAPLALPGGDAATALEAPVGEVLGWLVAAGAGQVDDVAPSVRWLGQVAIWAVELTARGAMVPLLRQRRRRSGSTRGPNASFSVGWTPALVESSRLHEMAREMPGSVAAVDPSVDARALTRSALTGMVDAICRDSARRVEVPAAPPTVRTSADVTEAFLARLDGSAFEAPLRVAGELVERADAWARPVTRDHSALIVRLDPPDAGDAWDLAVFAPATKAGSDGAQLVPIEHAIAAATTHKRDLEDQLARLERMLPVLLRAGATRRGQVVLSQDEAWELMAEIGPRLAAAGFDVRVPELATRSPSPMLRVFAEAAETVVGASQLADVRWSAVFGDVELTAAEIAALARDARPMVRSGGRWVALDRADLDAAAAALAERANTKQLTGADMLRLALGLEGSPLAGGISVEGGGWAADLLASAERLSGEPAAAPKGFVGELRSYQAEALAWLGFLDAAGIGGCLALDMGLGKTPTMLAHLLAGKDTGPALVVAPPAVVGNWAAEAARFTPDLDVVVHHGANRASVDELAATAAEADVVITTYGTAVRDVEAMEAVHWARVVLDEAQAIKNPASDTAQQLRRVPATTRVALTGTPIENGLGDLWAILDFTNPGLVGPRPQFIAQLSGDGDGEGRDGRASVNAAEQALRALNGILVFRRTKAEPAIAAELPDRIDELDHCSMTPEQIGLYQAVLDRLVIATEGAEGEAPRKGAILAAITALKQICNHPAAYQDDDQPLAGRSGKLARLEEIVDAVFAAGERVLIFTHFAEWGVKLAAYLTERMGATIECYHGGLTRTVRDRMIRDFQAGEGAGALVLSLKAGGTGLNLTAANHVVLYDRWWNPAVEDQARDRAWRIGQKHTVIAHRLVCPGTVDERVEEVVAGKRRIADMVLPKSSSIADLDSDQLRVALGIRPDAVLTEDIEADTRASAPLEDGKVT